MLKLILSLIFAILFIGCSNTPSPIIVQKVKINKEPSWLLNPQTSSKIAAVGCSQIHMNGVSAQKKLAISRAVEQIALQKKATIEVQSSRIKSRTNGSTNTSRQSVTSSVQSVKTTLSTRVKDFYTNKDKEICAWVEER